MEKNNSKILALKYRPRIFKDLIGQEIIAQTISNAIKINKTPFSKTKAYINFFYKDALLIIAFSIQAVVQKGFLKISLHHYYLVLYKEFLISLIKYPWGYGPQYL